MRFCMTQCSLIGIPTLIILDGETNKVISTNGRGRVSGDPDGAVRYSILHTYLSA